MIYNPKQYWQNRADPNSVREIPDFVKDYFQKHLRDAYNILEFGVGTGRMLDLYDNRKVTGIDFVDTYQEQCINRAKKLEMDFEHRICEYKDIEGYYDAIVCSKVLLHIKSENIDDVLQQLWLKSDKIIVWDAICQDAPHVFTHGFEGMQDAKIKGNELLFTL